MQAAEETKRQRQSEQTALLKEIERWLETPMVVLAFAWLGLLVLELTQGLSAGLETAGLVIWAIFLFDFGLRWVLAPRKLGYLKANWLTAISLILPALRIFRVFRAIRVLRLTRAARGIRLVRVMSSMNRGMRSLRRTLRRRGFGYVVGVTLIVTFSGAAGMYAFESNPGGEGLNDFGTALWWTAMMMTTMGSQYWPRTSEGRLLCLFLAIYAFAVFGYVTATIATFFIGRDDVRVRERRNSREHRLVP